MVTTTKQTKSITKNKRHKEKQNKTNKNDKIYLKKRLCQTEAKKLTLKLPQSDWIMYEYYWENLHVNHLLELMVKSILCSNKTKDLVS